jgi:SAM-dependent methyltransferase
MNSCPVCQQTAIEARRRLYDDRYGYQGGFQLVRCTSCGHSFLQNARFSDQEIQALYSTFYPRRTMKVEDYRPHEERSGFSAWLDGARASSFRWVPPRVRVLDIGCGFAQTLGYHARRGCEAWGVESDENVKRIAERHGFNVRIGVFRPEDLPQAYFDYVTLDQVIEHMRDPVATLAGVKRVLKPDGTVVVSTPNAAGLGAKVFGDRWIHWHAPYHLQFFTRRSMQAAAHRAGLHSRRLATVTSSEWLHYQWVHLATLPQPGAPSVFWSGSGAYTPGQRLALRAAALLHKAKINHLLTRLLDSAGWGDSQLFVLGHA